MKRMWLLHVAGNATLLVLLYFWLGIGDATASQLMASAVLGAGIVAAAVWLHGRAFGYETRRLPVFALWLLLAAVLYGSLDWLESRAYPPAAEVASWLTLQTRKPVKPASVLGVFSWIIRLFQWMILPVLLLSPRPFRPRRWFWMQCPILLLVAFWAPYKLMHWVPKVSGTGPEIMSFVARFVLAYLVSVTAWLALASLSSRGKPAVTQESTAFLP